MYHLLTSLLLLTPVLAIDPRLIPTPTTSTSTTTTAQCALQGTQTHNCAWANLDLWTISEAQPDLVSRGQIGNSLFHVAQTVDQDSCGWNDPHGKNHPPTHSKPKNRIVTLGDMTSSGIGGMGCSLVWELAQNISLSLSGHPVISIKHFNFGSDLYGLQPTWNKIYHPNGTSLIGTEVGNVGNIHNGMEQMIDTDFCPPGMGQTVNTVALIFEMDESVRESASVEFNFKNSNCGVLAGTLLSFNC
ncbi:hypothetical protein B0J14DRAFT_640756 [Halenospora varia]|nr:hypothetical protein B0J14DRAFT_640756 [Halenospora varia]